MCVREEEEKGLSLVCSSRSTQQWRRLADDDVEM